MSRKEVDMLQGPIFNGLLKIALPIMLMNVTQSLFNIADMTVLRIFASANGYAVGAVGVCGTLISLVSGLVIGISAGSNVVIAKNIGRGDKERTERAVGTSILFSLLGGLLLLLVGVLFGGTFLKWTNCPDALLGEATLYFKLYFAGAPLLMLDSFAAAIMRSVGDTKRPMAILIIGAIVKLSLNILFVGGLQLGVAGVAFSTLISWAVKMVISISVLLKNGGTVALKWNRIRFYKEELKDMLIVGVPAGLQQALYSIANVVITSTVNTFGPDASTGISIANQFDGLMYQITVAPSLAVMPYVSQNVGAKNPRRAMRSISCGILVAVGFGTVFGSLSAIFSPQLSSIMSNSPAVIEFSCQKMRIISSTYFINGINYIMGASMRALGKPMLPTITTLLYMCLFRFVWVYLIFPLCPTLTFLYLVWPVGWVLSILTLSICFIPIFKKLKSSDTYAS